MKRMPEKGFSAIELLLIPVVVGMISGLGYYVWQKGKSSPATSDSSQQATKTTKPEEKKEEKPTIPEGFVEYKNEELGFRFVYPEAWGEVNMKEGILNLSLEKGKGFIGSFSVNSAASFAVVTSDWEYTGAGRGGPDYAIGFTEYKKAGSFGDNAKEGDAYILKNIEDTKQVYAFETAFNFNGAIVKGEVKFSKNKLKLVGIEFVHNIVKESYNIETDKISSIVTEEHFQQIQQIVDSVTEL